jgi:hypothetical protein
VCVSYTMATTKLADIFGKPGTGAHSTRIFGYAAVDIGLTWLAAVGIVWWYRLDLTIRPWLLHRAGIHNHIACWILNTTLVFSALIVLGIALHRLFRVNTTLNVGIFGALD